MLNGKFVLIKYGSNGYNFKTGEIIRFANGYESSGRITPRIKDLDEFSEICNASIEPYKEHLTISELDWTPGKWYMDDEGNFWKVDSEGDELVYNANFIYDSFSTLGISNLKFQEVVNPNQKRIDELHKLIELENSYIDTANKCISGYEEELKELEG